MTQKDRQTDREIDKNAIESVEDKDRNRKREAERLTKSFRLIKRKTETTRVIKHYRERQRNT